MPSNPAALARLVARTRARQALGLIPAVATTRPPKVRTPRELAPCVHRGLPTGETLDCNACGGKKVPVPVYACAVKERCTVRNLYAGVACCRICPDYSPGAPN
jgi:hypothetical protein